MKTLLISAIAASFLATTGGAFASEEGDLKAHSRISETVGIVKAERKTGSDVSLAQTRSNAERKVITARSTKTFDAKVKSNNFGFTLGNIVIAPAGPR